MFICLYAQTMAEYCNFQVVSTTVYEIDYILIKL